MFFVVKVMINNMFYQPWNMQTLGLPRKLDKKVTAVIKAYTSYLYTVVTSFY